MKIQTLFSLWTAASLLLAMFGMEGDHLNDGRNRVWAAEAEESGWFNPKTSNAPISRSAVPEIRSLEYQSAEQTEPNLIRLMSNQEARPNRTATSEPAKTQRRRGTATAQNAGQPRKLAMKTDDSAEGELSWTPEENTDFTFSESMDGQIRQTFETDTAAEILPPEAIKRNAKANSGKPVAQNVAAEKPSDADLSPSIPTEPATSAAQNPAGVENFINELAKPTFSPMGSNPAPQKSVPRSATSSKDSWGKSSKQGAELKQAATPIDHFGNIGRIDNSYGQRTEDGGLVGNPYANGVFEYHPRFFSVDPTVQTQTREIPPCESFGQDAYGNDCVGYDECYCDGSCCEYCYDGCDGSCCNGCGGCGGYYDACGYGYCGGCCGLFSCIWSSLYPTLQHGELSAGVFGYQDPMDISGSSNFGVDLGFNWTMPKRIFGLIGQVGARYTRSGRENSPIAEEDYHRSQFFWTSGLFYRLPGGRWQVGGVYDSLRDDANWTYTVGQVRTEISYRCSEETTLGFRGAFHMDEKLLNLAIRDKDYSRSVSVQSYYTGFIRHTFVTGAEGTLSAGMTEENEALVGGRLEVPITNHSCLRNSFVYVFPKEKSDRDSLSDTWSASISWVVYLGGNSRFGLVNPFKPLFDVADNTTMIQKTK